MINNHKQSNNDSHDEELFAKLNMDPFKYYLPAKNNKNDVVGDSQMTSGSEGKENIRAGKHNSEGKNVQF